MSDDRRDSVAIVGMASVFPGAPDVERLWANVRDGVDSITDVPAGRWDPVYYDERSTTGDRFYCRRGGFVDDLARFDALAFGIMPVAAEGAEPDQLLTLQAAGRALADAGYDGGAPERTGVILGRGGYLTPGMARLNDYVRTSQQLVECLRGLLPDVGEAELARVKQEFQRQLGPVRPDNAIGLVPNLAASRIANRLDLRGPAYTVDAACASALVAVDHAVGELRGGRCDLVIAGGVHLCHDVTFWSVFTQLGALSRRQQIRPFDRAADGLLIGEGVGLLALERLDDAVRRGHRVYAVIRGTGVASDGRESSLMKPRVDGQVLALRRAWDDARLDPATAGLIEAHGTATPAGDEAELRTVREVFAGGVIGSIKSNIGHTMPAAGAAGLIKAALAVHHRALPPTLHCDDPHELLAGSPCRALTEAEDWPDELPRAGVNAFGFGGINAHIVLEAFEPRSRRRRSKAPTLALHELPGGGRLAVLDPTLERLAKAREIAARGRPWRGRKDIWFSPDGLLSDDGSAIAFIFPGIEATFEPHVDDVAAHFELPRPAARGASALERHGTELVGVGRLLDTALRRIGVRPDVIAGHSIGEWNGMIAAEMIPAERIDDFIDALQPGSLQTPNVEFLAVGCGAERATEIVDGIPGVELSHDNCPHQSILCGTEGAIAEALDRMRDARVLCQRLPFRSGFHSRAFKPYLDTPRAHVRDLPLQPPSTPLWSATLCAPYPDDPAAVRDLIIDHLTEPVRFRETVENLYEAGVRAFVQVGTGSLTSFIEDTLRDVPHLAVAANDPKRSGLDQLRRLAAALWVEGAAIDLDALPGSVTIERPAAESRARPLALGVPLVKLTTPLRYQVQVPGTGSFEGLPPAIAAELEATMREVADAQRQIVDAFRRASAAKPTIEPRGRVTRHTLSLASHPYLIDHCFYRQAAGWPSLADRFPVVPMTMHLELMMDAARELVPELTPIGIEKVRAYRWCAVEPSVTVDVRAIFDGEHRVEVRIGDYAAGTVVLGEAYPAPPSPRDRALRDPRPAPVDADRLYDDRWMFHGPAYRGVAELGPVAADGLAGTLVERPARGALLDNAGQLMGYWIMLQTERDRLAFPVRIERITFFGPPAQPGDRLGCRIWVDHMDDAEVRTDMELTAADGRVWCAIDGWTDRRFDTDEVVWPVLRYPEHNLLSERREGGYYLCREHWRAPASRELIARRYLDERELADYEQAGSRRKRGWLLGRMAVKDAVRDWLWKRGDGPRFPAEVAVRNDAGGRPMVSGPFTDDLRVSVAHKSEIAVAMVARGRDVGIDIERIEPRSGGFADIAYTDAERALWAGRGEGEVAQWQTRIWCAKEAAAKALGTGLEGNPRNFQVRDVAGERLLIAARGGQQRWVQTTRDGDHVVAWTIE